MKEENEKQRAAANSAGGQNDCPKKDKDGNCLVPGTYSDSDEIGGG